MIPGISTAPAGHSTEFSQGKRGIPFPSQEWHRSDLSQKSIEQLPESPLTTLFYKVVS